MEINMHYGLEKISRDIYTVLDVLYTYIVERCYSLDYFYYHCVVLA